MNTPVKRTQKRHFKMHAALLYTVMKAQAGTLSKAILETIQNSVDAKALRIDIELTNTRFSVVDDGKGIQSIEHIEQFFETFGTPHVKGDATFGRYRIGRGQAFSFGKNHWRTGTFSMNVDIKNDPDGYNFEDGLEPVEGCSITCELYNELSTNELLFQIRTLKEQSKYTPIPVYLNGERISLDMKNEKWTSETDDAYIYINNSRTLAIYNLGVIVCHLPAHQFGCGGVVVSKEQLEVNFARNEILYSECNVWKRIKPEVIRLADVVNGNKKEKQTEEWRTKKTNDLLAVNSQEEYIELYDLGIFTDIGGKHYSLKTLGNRNFTLGKRDCLLSDRIRHTTKVIVLNEKLLTDRFNGRDGHGWAILKELFTSAGKYDYWGRSENGNNKWIKNYIEFNTLIADYDSEHEIITDKKRIPKEAQLILGCLNRISHQVAMAVSYKIKANVNARSIGVMKSSTAEAITDGTNNIYFNIEKLKGYNGPMQGFPWMYWVLNVMVHEYLHDRNSGIGHTHDPEFYEMYHEVTTDRRMGALIQDLFKDWVRVGLREQGKVSSAVGSQNDILNNMEKISS